MLGARDRACGRPIACLALTRQGVPTVRDAGDDNRSAKGAYVIKEAKGPRQATLIATGSEVSIALEAAAKLEADGFARRSGFDALSGAVRSAGPSLSARGPRRRAEACDRGGVALWLEPLCRRRGRRCCWHRWIWCLSDPIRNSTNNSASRRMRSRRTMRERLCYGDGLETLALGLQRRGNGRGTLKRKRSEDFECSGSH